MKDEPCVGEEMFALDYTTPCLLEIKAYDGTEWVLPFPKGARFKWWKLEERKQAGRQSD